MKAGPQRIGSSNCLAKTQVYAKPKGEVYDMLPYFGSVHITSSDCKEDLLSLLLPRLYRSSLSRLVLSTCVPTVLGTHSTGISTCYPSTTSFDLALGPDLPRADQLYSGNLGYSAGRILTFLSLLIPAFSLLSTPLLLIGTASLR